MPKGQRNKPVVAPAPVEVIAPVAIVEPVEAPVEVIVADPVEVIVVEPKPEFIGVQFEPAPLATKPKQPSEDLAAYAKRIERAAQPLAVCIITHPNAVDGAIFEGVYAGIRLVNGPEMSARLSDGNTI
jgi:hypothetical protein